MGDAGLDAMPGSPTVRGLTATRPGTPTANQKQVGNRAPDAAHPLPSARPRSALPLPARHTCNGQNPRSPCSLATSRGSASLPLAASALCTIPRGLHAGTAATRPRALAQARRQLPSDQRQATQTFGLLLPVQNVLGDSSGGLVRGRQGESW